MNCLMRYLVVAGLCFLLPGGVQAGQGVSDRTIRMDRRLSFRFASLAGQREIRLYLQGVEELRALRRCPDFELLNRGIRDLCWDVPGILLEELDQVRRDRINRFTEAALASIAIGWDREGGAARERFGKVIRYGCALTFLSAANIDTYITEEEQTAMASHESPRPADTRRHDSVVVTNVRDAFCYFAKEYSGLLFQSEGEASWFVHRCIDSFEAASFAAGAALAPASGAAPRPVDKDSMDDDVLYS